MPESQPGVTGIICRCLTCSGSFEQKSGLPRGPLPPPDLFLRSRAGRGQGFLGEVVGLVDLYRMWLLVDVWSIMFQRDTMKNQGAEYYLLGRELI